MRSFACMFWIVAACSKGSSSTAPAPGSNALPPSSVDATTDNRASRTSPATIEAVLVELERLKNATCRCADTACTDAVTKQLDAYRPTVDATVKVTPPIPEQAQRIAQMEDEMRGCRRWVAAGLGSNSGGGETTAMFEIALVELERYRNKMCGCTDKVCGDQVAAEHDAWRAKTDAELGSRKPNPSQIDRRAGYDKGYADCKQKLR